MNDYHIVSFSGGKDSTAMLLHMIELKNRIDEVINIDTGMEFPQMYEHISKVKEIIEDNGIKYVSLKEPHGWDWWMFEKDVAEKTRSGHKGYGWPGPLMRWCTRHLKMDLINAHLKDLRTEYKVIQYIGLAADEKKRLERVTNQNASHRHPLVDWGWSESDCLKYCYAKGFDWGGLYDNFNRASCWCCPLQSISDLRSLYRNYPDLWKKLLEMDFRTHQDKAHDCHHFRTDCTLDELNVRFQKEIIAERDQTKLEDYLVIE